MSVSRGRGIARGTSPPRTDSSSPRERDRFANNSYSLVPKLKECDGRGTQRTSDLSVYKTRKSERCTDWKAPLQASTLIIPVTRRHKRPPGGIPGGATDVIQVSYRCLLGTGLKYTSRPAFRLCSPAHHTSEYRSSWCFITSSHWLFKEEAHETGSARSPALSQT